jgi:hypothetical protein
MATPDFSKVWASNSPLPEYTFSDTDYVTGWDFVGSAPPTKNEFDAWFKLVDTKLNWLYNQMQDTASKLYPVGSVYISFNSANPSTLFGGTWQRLKDTFLLASGDTYTANTTGGSATKTIAVNNMPAHNHSVNTAGAHTHSVSGTTGGAGSHSHTRGSMEITGQIKSADSNEPLTFCDTVTTSGALSMGGYHDWSAGGVSTYSGSSYEQINFKASSGWSGTTSVVGNHTHSFSATTSSNGAHTHTTNNTGGGLPLNIMPPYQTVYMWRRTA